ncbi:MAG: acyl-CoA dehydrogenase family protein [Pseudomonadales bacterium]|nr:acyl-CoA dehydrogenase family protein [Pseudomonadales bacterium]
MSAASRKESPEQAEFRVHCRQWLSENTPEKATVRLPESPVEIMTNEQMDYLRSWQKSAYEGGLIGCDYPKSQGGGGMTNCQPIANQEMQAAGVPMLPNVIGLGMGAPTIHYHAQDALKERLLPLLFSAENIWCQGFSEPGAGSDLANVQTFAEKVGDKWVINGHKVWTSLAHFADWMIILVRTDKEDKHNGLSYFVVPIKAALGKGVTVRPLIKITGETGFNEVLFDNLEITDDYRLDEVGNGWKVAMTTLLHERGAGQLVTPSAGRGVVKKESAGDAYSLMGLAKEFARDGKLASDDPVIREEIMKAIIRQEGSKQDARRSRVSSLCDHPMRLPLQTKLLMTEIRQDYAALALEIQGPASSLYLGDDNAPSAGAWPLAYMNSYGMTIAAGASEVQRNILGERILGLAKSK